MSLASRAALCALITFCTSTVLAAPSFQWVDNGTSATLQVVPSGTGSVATEIYISADFDLTSALLVDAVSFDLDTPGTNPFGAGTNPNVSGVTFGLVFDDPTDQVFASHGSVVFNSPAPVNYLTIGYNGTGTISATGIIGEGGVNFTGLSSSLIVSAAVDGDANGDGFVDLIDLNILGGNFGTMGGATLADGDFNGDGNVDLTDLNILGGNWTGSPAVSVPEPSAMLLMACCLAPVACRARS